MIENRLHCTHCKHYTMIYIVQWLRTNYIIHIVNIVQWLRTNYIIHTVNIVQWSTLCNDWAQTTISLNLSHSILEDEYPVCMRCICMCVYVSSCMYRNVVKLKYYISKAISFNLGRWVPCSVFPCALLRTLGCCGLQHTHISAILTMILIN